MKTVEIGRIGEQAATKFLKKNGYRIIGRNIHASKNEIDIIAKDKKHLLFVEVKTRSTDSELDLRFGTPASAVDTGKQKRTVAAARSFLKEHSDKRKIASLQPRFDVIEVFLDKNEHTVLKINHIINAFGA